MFKLFFPASSLSFSYSSPYKFIISSEVFTNSTYMLLSLSPTRDNLFNFIIDLKFLTHFSILIAMFSTGLTNLKHVHIIFRKCL